MPAGSPDCTKRLETIKDIPAGKCIYWFERTDMVQGLRGAGRPCGPARQPLALDADHPARRMRWTLP